MKWVINNIKASDIKNKNADSDKVCLGDWGRQTDRQTEGERDRERETEKERQLQINRTKK